MPLDLANLEDTLGLGRLGLRGTLAADPYRGERRRRRRYGLLDDDPGDLEEQILRRVRAMPPEDVENAPHGALQTALEVLDLPRNVIANVLALAVGAEPTSKSRFAGLRRVTAGDILAGLGLQAPSGWGGGGKVVNFLAGFLGDVALDPLTYLGGAGVARKLATGERLTQAGAAAARDLSERWLQRVGERAARGVESELAGEVGSAARRRLLERLGQRATRVAGLTGEQAARPAPLAARYLEERGAEALTDLAGRSVARRAGAEAAGLTTRDALTATTRHLREFHPLDLPAALAGGVAAAVSPGAGAAVGRGYEALRRITRPLVNPLSLVVPEVSARLTRAGDLGRLAERLGLDRLGRLAGRIPGVGPLLEGVREAGRELRGRFSTLPLPPRPGDAADQARYETQRLERWVDRQVGRRQRGVAVDEPRKLRAWIGQAAELSELDPRIVGDVLGDVAERYQSYLRGELSGAELADSVRKLVRDAGGEEARAERLVRFVRDQARPDLAPQELDLFGNPLPPRPRPPEQGMLLEAGGGGRGPSGGVEPVEISDGLREMTVRVLADWPGAKIPRPADVHKALIDRYGSRAVQAVMRGRVRGADWEPEIREAIAQAEKGLPLFRPRTAGIAIGTRVRASDGRRVYEGTVASLSPSGRTAMLQDDRGETIGSFPVERLGPIRPPDLAPAQRRLGDAVHMIDGEGNEYAGTLDVVDADTLLVSHRPRGRGGVTALEPDPAYPPGFQAREREAEASVKQVNAIARQPKLELLTDFGSEVTGGPPVVWNTGSRDAVVQGNGRAAGMLAWTGRQWADYRAALGARGIDVPPGIERPMLVRRLRGSEEQARRLAALGQRSAALRQTRIEEARATLSAFGVRSVEDVPPVTIAEPVTRDNVLRFVSSPANRDFREWLLGGLTPQRREQVLAQPEELAEKVNAAFVGILPASVQRMAASMPREIEDMFTAAAPIAAYLHSQRRLGLIRPEYDLYDALDQGAHFFGRLRSKRGSYAAIVRELDELAETPTFEGLRDEVADATQRGLAVAVGLVKASRSANPSQTLLDALGRIVAAARADDPSQLAMFAVDSAENAARAYLTAFLPPASAERLLARMGHVRAAEAGRLATGPTDGGASDAQTGGVQGVSDLPPAAVPGQPGGAVLPSHPAAAAAGGEVQAGGGPGPPPAPGGDARSLSPDPGSNRARVYADLDAHLAARGVGERERARVRGVLDRFDDAVFDELRVQAGTPEQAAAIASQTGREPRAAYYFEEALPEAERAALRARSVIRLFERGAADKFPDFENFLEELGHHGWRNFLAPADRDELLRLYRSAAPGEWARRFAAGPHAGLAEYYAGDPNEWFSRMFADHVMGRELAADPAQRSIFARVWERIVELWRALTGRGELPVDPRFERVVERYYRGPLERTAPGIGGGTPRLPGMEPPPPPPLPPVAPLPAEGLRGGTPRLPWPVRPPGPAGRLEIADPVREAANYLEARAQQRIAEERAAGVPSAKLTTERQMGYLMRFLLDTAESRLGQLLRRGGMTIKSRTQWMRTAWAREKFTAELNRVTEGVNQVLSGRSAGDARYNALIEELGLRPGEQLPTLVLDPVLRHTARELESVRLIGSAEFLKEAARRFGRRLGDGGAVVPAGFTRVAAPQLGDVVREFAFPQAVAHVLERHVAQLQEPSRVLGGYRRLLNLWKGWALVAPAYHLRNVLGNVWNASLLDGFDARSWAEARRVQQAVAGGGELTRRIAGLDETYGSLYRKLLVDHDLVGSGFFGLEFRASARRVQEILRRIEQPASGRRVVEALRGAHTLQANQALGQIAEDAAKIGMVISRMRRGDDLAEAVARTRRALFDYGDLTDFERGTATALGLRDVMPFYTWTRKNAELLLTIAMTDPRRLALLPKLQGEAERVLAGDETLPPSLRPPHVAEEGGVQISGGANPKFLNLGYMLPIGEARFVNPLTPREDARNLLEQVGGPARIAGELAANYDPFFGQRIREYPGQAKEFLGVNVPPEAAHVLRAVRPLNQIQQAQRLARSSESLAGAAAGIAAQAAGARVFPVEVARQVFSQERALNEQLAAVRRDLKRRIVALDGDGRAMLADGELRRLAGLEAGLRAQREALPLAEVRAATRRASDERRRKLAEYLAAVR